MGKNMLLQVFNSFELTNPKFVMMLFTIIYVIDVVYQK